jgi:hypothetical protein
MRGAASFNYPKSSLHFSSGKRGLTVGGAERRSALDKGWLDAPPNVGRSYRDHLSVNWEMKDTEFFQFLFQCAAGIGT